MKHCRLLVIFVFAHKAPRNKQKEKTRTLESKLTMKNKDVGVQG